MLALLLYQLQQRGLIKWHFTFDLKGLLIVIRLI